MLFCLIVEISLIVSRFGKNRASQVSSYVFPTPPEERKSVARGRGPRATLFLSLWPPQADSLSWAM